VFVYSDGAFEISRPDGSMWPFEEFVATLTAPGKGAESPIDALVTRVRSVSERDDFHDDFSMVELVFS
jgi:sigma-B regulation protein RsbU (phosphoserine phosphatase)